jgi:hypothetical protein
VAPNEGYKAAYVTFLCLGVLTTALSMAYRLRNAHQMQAHVRELGQQGPKVSASAAQRQAQQHEWELVQTHRTKVILSLSLLSIFAQGSMPIRAALEARALQRARML